MTIISKVLATGSNVQSAGGLAGEYKRGTIGFIRVMYLARICGEGKYYFGGGFLTNSTPFSMLPLRPWMQASRSFCSCWVTPPRMLMAFSAPLTCSDSVSFPPSYINTLENEKWYLRRAPRE